MDIYSFYPDNDDDQLINFRYKNVMKRVHHGKTIYVEESGCFIPRGVTYDGVVFSISSFFKTRRILPGTLENYSIMKGRLNSRVVMHTTKFGRIEFNVKNIVEVKAIEFILKNFNN